MGFSAGYLDIDDDGGANARWWSQQAYSYLLEHGEALGTIRFRWCPEGLEESRAALLGPLEELRNKRVLEVGCGAAQCSRWLVSRGVAAQACDVAPAMIEQSDLLDEQTGVRVGAVVADARELPYAEASFDTVFTAYGVIPFVSDAGAVHREVARVLKPGGLWVYATSHPIRWCFPDDPGPGGLVAGRSYWDTRPYVEREGAKITYAEYHRTIGQHVEETLAAGFNISGVLEPTWEEGNDYTWGGWSPGRGAIIPGTVIISATRAL